MSHYIWQYYLVIPASAVAAADAVAPALNNPDGVEATFRRYPLPDEEGNYSADATHYLASFVATESTDDGIPSKQLLEGALSDNPDLANILWVRTKNPHHPATTEAEKGVTVASNWAAFPVGGGVGWDAVIEALG